MVAILGALGAFFLKIYTFIKLSKIAIRFFIFTAISALLVGVLTSVQVIVAGIVPVMPQQVVNAWSMFIPSNFIPCVTAILTVQGMIWIWNWKIRGIIYVATGK